MKVILIGCGKTKARHAAAAQDIYTGALFKARRRYAEATGCQWFILSARHFTLKPSQVIEPYDQKLIGANYTWAAQAVVMLFGYVDAPVEEYEIHAGATYCQPFCRMLRAAGFKGMFCTPVAGLGIGQQLHFYADAVHSPKP